MMRSPFRPARQTTADASSVPTVVPADPRLVIDGSLDPSLTSVLGALGPYRQRLWIRRIVRRTWLALAAILIAELVLWTLARFIPITWAPVAALVIPAIGILAWLVAIVRARPGIGETALAVDGEGQLGDRVSSALELATAFPASAGPADPDASSTDRTDAAETDRFVRRQRADALRTIRMAPAGLFRPRVAQRPAIAIVVAALLLVPVIVVPNPQDIVIAQQRQVAEAADRQADRLDELADELEFEGRGLAGPPDTTGRGAARARATAA